MAQFKYKARTMEGKVIKGQMTAGDEAELQRSLHEQDAFLISAKVVKNTKGSRELKSKVLADFARQLGTLTASGVTLVRALNIISNGEAVKPRERAIYDSLLRQLRQGIALSDAMESQEGAFPPLMVYMYRSAETSGNLDKVSMQMAVHFEKNHKLNSKISVALTYPKILAIMVVLIILILTNFVLPQFQELFEQMEELPLSTRIVLGFSNLLQSYWPIVLVVVVLLVIGVNALLRVPKVRLKWHRLTLRVPLFGKLQRVICTYRFARSLSSLYSAGIPIVSALQIARKTIGNDYIDSQFDDVIPFVRAGNNLSDGLDRIDGFVKKLCDTIRVGEETGSLDSMLQSTADSMEYDADMAITKIVSYVEPIMLIIMGVIVAFVMVSMFSALYGSYDAIGGMS